MRGLAALYVVIYHSTNGTWSDRLLPHWCQVAHKLMAWGHFAVAVFIVLSGYCLMLPVVRSADGQLRGGFFTYIKRRARRILPPYYASIGICLIFIAVVPALRHPNGIDWDNAMPAFRPDVLISHLLLVHNLNQDWIFRINGPLWSVATEWQIYFVFPALLLPVWRRYGNWALVTAGFAAGYTPHYLLHGSLDLAAPWYIGLFALGMAGADICFSSRERMISLKEKIVWGRLCAAAWMITALFGLFRAGWIWNHLWISDAMVGISTMLLIIFCSETVRKSKNDHYPLVLRILDSPSALRLGLFSYSLYLMHPLVLALAFIFLRPLISSVPLLWLLNIVVGVPLSLFLTYLFHLGFERRFMSAPGSNVAPVNQQSR